MRKCCNLQNRGMKKSGKHRKKRDIVQKSPKATQFLAAMKRLIAGILSCCATAGETSRCVRSLACCSPGMLTESLTFHAAIAAIDPVFLGDVFMPGQDQVPAAMAFWPLTEGMGISLHSQGSSTSYNGTVHAGQDRNM